MIVAMAKPLFAWDCLEDAQPGHHQKISRIHP